VTTQRIIPGDCIAGLRTLPDASVHCCVTSPPYWGLRDYGHDGQIGLESTPEAYVARMVEVFREVRRVLRDDGTCWVNLGDSYNGIGGPGKQNGGPIGPTAAIAIEGTKGRRISGLKPKDLVGIPWRVAFALQADGWWLRQDIIWAKPNPMPESVRDRCTKAHEYVFLLTKSERYFYDAEAVKEQSSQPGRIQTGYKRPNKEAMSAGPMARGEEGFNHQFAEPDRVWCDGTSRNRRSVWTVTTRPYSGAHFAVMPPDLVEPCIKAGCPDQCCPACGKGWQRVIEDTGERIQQHRSPATQKAIYAQDGHAKKPSANSVLDTGFTRVMRTTGWQPACDCVAAGTIPGTVLDPFAGSGTTLAVAAELGRNGIGCELNPEYIELANQRIRESRGKCPLFDGSVA
jgi:DNA modification methylase